MSTATLERRVEPGAPPPVPEEPRRVPRWVWGLLVLAGWIAVWSVTKGNNTLYLGGQDTTELHDRLSEWGATLGDSALTRAIGDTIESVVDFFRHLIAVPVPPSPAPVIGWLGVVAIATWIGYAVANWRIALLVLPVLPLLRGLRLLGGLDGPPRRDRGLGGDHRPDRLPARRLDGPEPGCGPVDHPAAGPPADHADLRLPGVRGDPVRGRRADRGDLHPALRPAPDRADRRLRHPGRLRHRDRGDRLAGPDHVAAAAPGADPDGAQHDHPGPEPDDPGRAVDGDHRGVHQRPRPGASRSSPR